MQDPMFTGLPAMLQNFVQRDLPTWLKNAQTVHLAGVR
jgi:hypothetical protein